ncbi:MAG: hybrid sensor histidine kinase/response regulator [Thiomargarita sp.]|nr:hybrid sensor histidine kinase/response regulator [Thiomargarita sp.]
MSSHNTVLIVDDTPENIGVLFECLAHQNFHILVAENGKNALDIAEHKHPDLILLDIMMPGIDGFETCRQLKSNTETQDIPVIFMTALSDTSNKIKGFQLGAVDYITKPFQQYEVLARIKTHLSLRQLQKQLEVQNEQLIQLNQDKNEFLGIAAHDIKNPLGAIQSAAEVIEIDYDTMSKTDLLKRATNISNATRQLFTLIDNLLDINAIESGKSKISLSMIDMLTVLEPLVMRYRLQAKKKNIVIQFQASETQYPAFVDENTLTQILDNLISNAVKYSPYDKQVDIRISLQDNKSIRCEIQDNGLGISALEQEKLFQKFSKLTPRPTGGEHSTGLGLFIVKKLVDAMKGKVWCESEEGEGTTFFVEFLGDAV